MIGDSITDPKYKNAYCPLVYPLQDYDCEGKDKCLHVKIFEYDGPTVREKCIKECPLGTYERLYKGNANLFYTICEPCPNGCSRCDIGHTHDILTGEQVKFYKHITKRGRYRRPNIAEFAEIAAKNLRNFSIFSFNTSSANIA